MSLQCIIFDMDGTLTRTNQLIFDSFNYIVKKYTGKLMENHEIAALFGPPEEGAIVKIVGEEKLDQAMKEYLTFYRKNHGRLAQLYPGIMELLKDIKRRNKHLALFTGKGTHTTKITLEEFGLLPFFDYVVTGNDVVLHKPSAEGIRKILDHFAVKPEKVLMVGDSVADVKASHEAGVKIAAVLWDSYGKERVLRMNTDYIFHDVKEFHSWLKNRLD
ncbi:MAG: HAD-IA family hydrolase [Ignavibacteriales bacterium]|nr:HAD-IA family hydrolase [Ignavibacteriales bacterium]